MNGNKWYMCTVQLDLFMQRHGTCTAKYLFLGTRVIWYRLPHIAKSLSAYIPYSFYTHLLHEIGIMNVYSEYA